MIRVGRGRAHLETKQHPKSPWFFIHVPRTGGTMMKRYLKEHGLPGLPVCHKAGGLAHPDMEYKYFMFVRHPLDRAVSLAAYGLSYRDPTDRRAPLEGHIMPLDKFSEWWRDLFHKWDSVHIREIRDKIWWTAPQVSFVGPKVPINFMGRFENLWQDFAKLCHMIPEVTAPGQNVRINTSCHRGYKWYFDQDRGLEALVRSFYKIDFEEYGYE